MWGSFMWRSGWALLFWLIINVVVWAAFVAYLLDINDVVSNWYTHHLWLYIAIGYVGAAVAHFVLTIRPGCVLCSSGRTFCFPSFHIATVGRCFHRSIEGQEMIRPTYMCLLWASMMSTVTR